jgi:AsmA protein
MTLQGVQLNLKAKDGLIAIQPSINKFYTGSYSGNINADMRNNNSIFALNEKVSHVQVEPLLKDFNGAAKIGGLLDASLQLEGQGSEVKELKSSFAYRLLTAVHRYLDLFEELAQAERPDQLQVENAEEALF